MTRQGAAKRLVWVSLLLGLALFGGLVAYQGLGEVFSAVALAGWGLFAVTAAHLVVLLADAAGWRALLRSENRRSLPRIAWMWWIGNSVNDLLPVARIGGELVRARLLGRSGVPGALAGGSVVVSLTAGIFTLLLFAGAGVVFLAALKTNVGAVVLPVIIGLTTFGCLLFGFYLAQRAGLFLRLARVLGRLARRDWSAFTGGAAALDSAVIEHYRNRRAFIVCCLWRLGAWLAGVVEVWLALYVLGHPVSFREAFILESLGQAIRTLGFFIPGALGVQEGGFLLVGTVLGLPGETGLGVSLVKRVRDLVLGLPGLAAWQFTEGAELFKRRTGT